MAESSFVEKLEDSAASSLDHTRNEIPEGPLRTYYDLQIGTAKGVYGFGKGLVTGVVDLAILSWKLNTFDPETYGKIWDLAKKGAKNQYILAFGSWDEKKRLVNEQLELGKNLYEGIKKQVLTDWDDAKKKGKEAELISKWSTRGVLEVASFFVGAGEVKAAAGTVKAAEAVEELSKVGRVLDEVHVACETTEAAKVAATADKAMEAAKAAKAAEDAAKAEKAIEAAGAVKQARPLTAPLKFGSDDLVYGPSAGGKLRRLQEEAGGKLLTDLEKPFDKTWGQFTKDTLDSAAASGRQVQFDLSHMTDIDNVLAGTGKFGESVTAEELRHIRDNWDKFKVKPKFYMDGNEVRPPWLR